LGNDLVPALHQCESRPSDVQGIPEDKVAETWLSDNGFT